MNVKVKNTLKQTKTMLNVDFRRMFTMPLFYIMLAISFIIPILVLVMTSMMDGTVSVNPQTGAATVIEGFKNVWQIIGIQRVSNVETIPPPRILFHPLLPVKMDPPCREQLTFYLILEAFSSSKCDCCITCRLIEFKRAFSGMS